MHALAEWAPADTAALPRDLPQLDHGQAHHSVGAAEAVVFDAELQLVALQAFLVTQGTEEGEDTGVGVVSQSGGVNTSLSFPRPVPNILLEKMVKKNKKGPRFKSTGSSDVVLTTGSSR